MELSIACLINLSLYVGKVLKLQMLSRIENQFTLGKGLASWRFYECRKGKAITVKVTARVKTTIFDQQLVLFSESSNE